MTLKVSPSQINMFLNEPAIWVLNKFYKVYGDMGPSAWRGTAVEKGLESVLVHGKDFEFSLDWAGKVYEEEAKGSKPEGYEEQKALIPGMLKNAVDLFIQLDGLKGTQIKLTGILHGVEINGIADFDYETFYADLKTTQKCPSCVENLSSEHLTQLAVYKILSGREQKIAYVTDKKSALYAPTPEQLWAMEKRVKFAIRAMKAAYDMSNDNGNEFIAMMYPPRDMGSFYWDEKTIKAANKVWN